ncbi:hypothetical protein TL16_g11937 [Triparma laevis f. inornata]|uniref:Uncharacterized protein n=1 Tax=Triparma laevis f. inornata TaxID=1714386 RepID=A0A9W7BN84_9STRA|nr:hypothetical protein TL16_g11937 [Triparma laevis f. inornata]
MLPPPSFEPTVGPGTPPTFQKHAVENAYSSPNTLTNTTPSSPSVHDSKTLKTNTEQEDNDDSCKQEENEEEEQDVNDQIGEQIEECGKGEDAGEAFEGGGEVLEKAGAKVAEQLLEMISIFINFLQNYALITMIDVSWPISFTWLTDWMYFFTFFWLDVDFNAGEAPAIVLGMSIAPVLVLCFDHGLFPTLTTKASDDDGSHVLGVGEKEERAMIRVVLISTVVIVLGMLPTELRFGLPLAVFGFFCILFFFTTIPHNKAVSKKIAKIKNKTTSAAITNTFKKINEAAMKLPFAKHLPKRKLFWKGFWPLIVLPLLVTVILNNNNYTGAIVSLWIAPLLWAIVDLMRLRYLKSVLYPSCRKMKLNYKLERVMVEFSFFIFFYSVVYLSGINACLKILRAGSEDVTREVAPNANQTNTTTTALLFNATTNNNNTTSSNDYETITILHPVTGLFGFLLLIGYTFIPLIVMFRCAKNVKNTLKSGNMYQTDLDAMAKRFRDEVDLSTTDVDVESGSPKKIVEQKSEIETNSFKFAVVGVLLSSFKENFWWWKVNQMLERGILACVIMLEWSPWIACATAGVGRIGCILARPYWSSEEVRADIIGRTATLLTVVAAAFIEYNELTGDELWLEILLNGSVLFTVLVLIKEIGPVRVVRSVRKFFKKLSRTKNYKAEKNIDDLTMAEFQQLSGEIQLALTLKFPQNWVIIDFWQEQVPAESPNKLTGDVKVLVQCAEAMNSGEALVWYSIVTKRFVFIRDHTSADAVEQRVFSVNWSDQNLSGQVPAELFNQLPRLTQLNLKKNEVSYWKKDVQGLTTPTFKRSVKANDEGRIRLVKWPNSDLIGELPEQFFVLSSLEELCLDRNKLQGHLPESIGWLVNLEYLDLSDNRFTGVIPAAIGWLVKLNHLCLEGNSFSGALPVELALLKDLRILDVCNNYFEHTPGGVVHVPEELTAITRHFTGSTENYFKYANK